MWNRLKILCVLKIYKTISFIVRGKDNFIASLNVTGTLETFKLEALNQSYMVMKSQVH